MRRDTARIRPLLLCARAHEFSPFRKRRRRRHRFFIFCQLQYVCVQKKNHLILAAALSHNENIVGVFYICVWILNFASDYAIAAPVTD